jgi:hypothetical protein
VEKRLRVLVRIIHAFQVWWCGWHKSFNVKPKATASASVDRYTLSADAVAFGLALNEIRPTGAG